MKKYQEFTVDQISGGRVNLATGVLEFMHQDTDLVSHIYSSARANINSPYGKGFRLNLEQKLVSTNDDKTEWAYTDAMGETHTFVEKFYYLDTNNERVYLQGVSPTAIKIALDGKLTYDGNEIFIDVQTKSGMTIHTEMKDFNGAGKIETRPEEIGRLDNEKVELYLPVNYIVDNNVTYGFNANGNLVTIYDGNDMQIAIVLEKYDDDNYRISCLVDKNERETKFAYTENGKLDYIIDFDGRKTSFNYVINNGEFLSSISYMDVGWLSFSYPDPIETSDYMYIRPKSQIGLRFAFDSEKRVTNIVDYAPNAVGVPYEQVLARKTRGKCRIDISYGSTVDVANGKTGYTSKYIFDNDGEMLAEYLEFDNAPKYATTYIKTDAYNFEFVQTDFETGFIPYPDVQTEAVAINSSGNPLTMTEYMGHFYGYTGILSQKGNWTLTRLYDNPKKTVEYSRINAVVRNESIVIRREKSCFYDVENLTLESCYETIEQSGYVSQSENRVLTRKSEYNVQNKLRHTIDTVNGVVNEIIYDKNGNIEKEITYHKDSPNVYFCNEQKELPLIASANEYIEPNNHVRKCNDKGFLTDIVSGGSKFQYDYDEWGCKTFVKLNGVKYAEYSYEDNDGDSFFETVRVIYANGDEIIKTVDKFNRLLSVTKNGVLQIEYAYTNDLLTQIFDHIQERSIQYEYDNLGNTVQVSGDAGAMKYVTYDGGINLRTVYQSYIGISSPKYEIEKDVFGRVVSIKNSVETQRINYVNRDGSATNIIASVQSGNDNTAYRYDNNGNIVSILENGKTVARYVYDGFNRLARENDIEIEYDCNGNILCRGDNEYKYDGDKMMSFNGEQCKYDIMGNPTVYRDKPMQWELGKLARYNGSRFYYNGFGLRRQKNNTEYYWLEGKLMYEQRAVFPTYDGEAMGEYPSDDLYLYNRKIVYVYDSNGDISGMELNGVPYYFRKNIMGDVTHIFDANKNLVGAYKYDAYGKPEVLTNIGGVAMQNPIRYRGYYYDIETGLYYVKSRYYDPETGRFVSPDNIEILDISRNFVNGLNLYAYCLNNPIMMTDMDGCWGAWNAIKNAFKWVNDTIVQPVVEKVVDTAHKIGDFLGSVVDTAVDIANTTPIIISTAPLGLLTSNNNDNPLHDFGGGKLKQVWDNANVFQKIVGGIGIGIATVGAIATAVGITTMIIGGAVSLFAPPIGSVIAGAGIAITALGFLGMISGVIIAGAALGIRSGPWG